MRRVPTGRDREEKQCDFSSFLHWPTKRQTRLYPVRAAPASLERDDNRTARRRDDGVLELHRRGAWVGVEREAIILRRIHGNSAAERQEWLYREYQTVGDATV